MDYHLKVPEEIAVRVDVEAAERWLESRQPLSNKEE